LESLLDKESLVKNKGEEAEFKSGTASMRELYQFLSPKQRIWLYVGFAFAVIAGAGQPAFVLYLNTLYDAFTPETPIEEILDKTTIVALVYLGIGVFLWVFHLVFQTIFGIAAEHVGKMFRVRYLESILNQEVSWFDMQNIQALPGEVSKQCHAV
jgi:ABC-type multidrug transport system fused ATPase/permease subunit